MATIITKNSSTASSVPLNTQLVQGELAVNVTDKRLFTENASGTVVELGTNPSTLVTSNTFLAFGRGNTEDMRLTSTGLGIGTSSVSPAGYGLHIKGSANQVAIKLENPQARTFQILSNGSTGGGGAANGNFTIYDDTAGADRLILSAAGNLGLGVTPSAWASGTAALQMPSGVAYTQYGFSQNAYYNAGYKYVANGAASLYQQTGGQNLWYTASSGTAGAAISFTQAMTLDASGNLLVGVTSASAGKFYIRYDTTGSGTVIQTQNETSGGRHISFRTNGNSEVGSITATAASTAYNTSSDYRLKENVQPMTGALAKVAQLKPVTYTWKADGSAGEGFIAHELAEVCPAAVTGEKDAVDDDGNPVYQGIDVSFLVATLTAAIQELKAELDEYKAAHP